jgi:putative ABC transport system permease protein
MRHLLFLAWRSAWNRRLTLGLVMAAVALSVMLLLGVERLRHDARESFSQSVAGTDLVIGARTSPVQLMLYAIFRMGEATSNMSWKSVEEIAQHPSVAWVVPLSLGDSHRGFPVVGTSDAYFEHFKYGASRPLAMREGKVFEGLFDTVIGAEVAERLDYEVGDRITLNHGMREAGFTAHDDKPFNVTGILERTGTPVDSSLHISLEAMEAIHLDWQGGAPVPGVSIPAEYVRKFDLSPKSVTAVLVGLESRAAVFRVQRYINEYKAEPLVAVLPGVALDQLWQVVGIVERTLLLVSAMVVLVGLGGLMAVILAGLNERRRELAILRSVGAQPAHIFAMLIMEGFGITVLGTLSGLVLLSVVSLIAGPLAETYYGLSLQLDFLSMEEVPLLIAVIGVGLLASLLPGYRAYRLSLADGLTPRL